MAGKFLTRFIFDLEENNNRHNLIILEIDLSIYFINYVINNYRQRF